MRVRHLSCATMCPPLGKWLVGGDGRLICHVLLIESNDGLILVDTGLGRDDLARPRERLGRGFLAFARPTLDPAETAIAQIEALGLGASDVRHVIPTHLDIDHCGALSDFPDAQVHVLRAEHDAAMARATRIEKARYRRAHFAHSPRWTCHDPGGDRWRGFTSVRAIEGVPQVLLVPLQGHTRGHTGVAVDTGRGWLLHAGDAYFHHDEMKPSPRCPPGLRWFQWIDDMDRRARFDNQRRLRELVAASSDVRVFCAHDGEELAAARAAAESPVRIAVSS